MESRVNQLNKEAGSKFFSALLFLIFVSLIILYLRVDTPIFAILFLGIIFVVGILSTQKLALGINNFQKTWLLFIVYTLSCTIIMENFIYNLDRVGTVKSSVFFLLIYIIILYFAQFCDRVYFFKLLRNFLAGCSILGIVEWLTKFQFYTNFITMDSVKKTYLIYGVSGTPNYRLILFFGHPIFLSIFLAIFLLLLIYIPFGKKTTNVIFETAGLICLVLTQSRSSWLSFSIVLLLYAFASNRIHQIRKKSIYDLIIVSFLMVLLVFLLNYINPNGLKNLGYILFDRITNTLANPESASGARLANLSLINYIPNLWILIFGGGNGYALGLLKLNPSVNGWTNAIDNQYLTFLINYGVIGLLLFLLFMVKCIKIFLLSKDEINKMITLLLISIFVAGYFFEFYQNMYLCYFVFILIAFVRSEDN